MKIAILTIATGEYVKYIPDFVKSFEKNLKGIELSNIDFHIFTDANFEDVDGIWYYKYVPENWTISTLMRFHAFNKIDLKNYDFVYFVDVDMVVVDEINIEEILPENGFVGVIHPGFCHVSKDLKQEPIYCHEAVEKKKESTAYISDQSPVIYCQGCFFGAEANKFIEMSKQIAKNIDIDFNNRIIAIWHDESHLNKFFNSLRYKMKLLLPNYAHPEVYDVIPNRKSIGYSSFEKEFNLRPKIKHLYKGN